MIRFENLTKTFRINGRSKLVIDDLSLTLPSGRSIALLGRNGAGKSTLLEIVAGNLRPDAGRVISDGTISFPVGLASAFHRDLSGAENVRFVARIYGVDTEELLDFVDDFAELGESFRMPVRSYSSGMKARLAFGASMGIRFDTYLVDEVTSVGDAAFKRKSNAVFRDRLRRSGAIVVAHNTAQIRRLCEAGAVLEAGRITYHHDVEAAIAHHEANIGTDGD